VNAVVDAVVGYVHVGEVVVPYVTAAVASLSVVKVITAELLRIAFGSAAGVVRIVGGVTLPGLVLKLSGISPSACAAVKFEISPLVFFASTLYQYAEVVLEVMLCVYTLAVTFVRNAYDTGGTDGETVVA
jgi:hypothetical protein